MCPRLGRFMLRSGRIGGQKRDPSHWPWQLTLGVELPPQPNRSPAAPPPPPPPPSSCPLAGGITLALTSAIDLSAPYAVCFARFMVEVDSGCELKVVPVAAASKWQYSALWSPVPVQDRNMQASRVKGWREFSSMYGD